jgi:hypothetical protein
MTTENNFQASTLLGQKGEIQVDYFTWNYEVLDVGGVVGIKYSCTGVEEFTATWPSKIQVDLYKLESGLHRIAFAISWSENVLIKRGEIEQGDIFYDLLQQREEDFYDYKKAVNLQETACYSRAGVAK